MFELCYAKVSHLFVKLTLTSFFFNSSRLYNQQIAYQDTSYGKLGKDWPFHFRNEESHVDNTE